VLFAGLRRLSAAVMDSDDSEELVFNQQNPKQAGSKSFRRYERYKHAKNMPNFYEAGGLRADLLHDSEREFVRGRGGALVVPKRKLESTASMKKQKKRKLENTGSTKKKKQPRSRKTLMRFDSVAAFDQSNATGTVVDVSTTVVTVLPHAKGAAPVVISRSESASILPDTAPDALSDLRRTTLYLKHLDITLAPGDSVETTVDGASCFVLFVSVSRQRMKCLRWRCVSELASRLQFDGFSDGGADLSGSHVPELVLSNEEISLPVNSVIACAWACSPTLVRSAAVIGFSRVFFANLYETDFALRRLPETLLDCSSSEQSQVLCDRIAVADEIGRLMRCKKDKLVSTIRTSRNWWLYLVRELPEDAVRVSCQSRSVSRQLPSRGSDVSRSVMMSFESVTLLRGIEGEFHARDARIGRDQLATSGTRTWITRQLAVGDTVHALQQVDLKFCRSTSALKITVLSVKEDVRATPTSSGPRPPPTAPPPREGGQIEEADLKLMIGASFTHNDARVTVLRVDAAAQTATFKTRVSGNVTTSAAASVYIDFSKYHLQDDSD
jgi:hypothetical protein